MAVFHGWISLFQYSGTTPTWRLLVDVFGFRWGVRQHAVPRMASGGGILTQDRQFIGGLGEWEGSVRFFYDDLITPTDFLTDGSSVFLEFHMTGAKKFTGGGSVHEYRVDSPIDGPNQIIARIQGGGGTATGLLDYDGTTILEHT